MSENTDILKLADLVKKVAQERSKEYNEGLVCNNFAIGYSTREFAYVIERLNLNKSQLKTLQAEIVYLEGSYEEMKVFPPERNNL